MQHLAQIISGTKHDGDQPILPAEKGASHVAVAHIVQLAETA